MDRLEPESRVIPFNFRQWAEGHELLDKTRFDETNAKVNSVIRVMGVAGLTIIGILGWSLKLNIDQVTKQDNILHAVYGVANQVQQVQATAVPKPPN